MRSRATLALAAVTIGGGLFGASLGGVARVDATLQSGVAATKPKVVRVDDRRSLCERDRDLRRQL